MSYHDDGYDDDGMDDRRFEGNPELRDLAFASVPDSLKGIRACMRCGMLKTAGQFTDEGCSNCPFLKLADNPELVNTCTTAFWEGQVAVIDPRSSWAAKWLRIDHYVAGVYAISITGQFPQEIESHLEADNRRWRCQPPK